MCILSRLEQSEAALQATKDYFPLPFFLCGWLTAILSIWIYKGSFQCPAFQKENTKSVENAMDAQKSFCAYAVAF